MSSKTKQHQQMKDSRTRQYDDSYDMEVNEICFTQCSISNSFKCGVPLEWAINMLESRKLLPRELPLIRIGFFNNRWASLDNRRLYCYKRAKNITNIPVKIVTSKREFARKNTSKNNGKSVKIRTNGNNGHTASRNETTLYTFDPVSKRFREWKVSAILESLDNDYISDDSNCDTTHKKRVKKRVKKWKRVESRVDELSLIHGSNNGNNYINKCDSGSNNINDGDGVCDMSVQVKLLSLGSAPSLLHRLQIEDEKFDTNTGDKIIECDSSDWSETPRLQLCPAMASTSEELVRNAFSEEMLTQTGQYRFHFVTNQRQTNGNITNETDLCDRVVQKTGLDRLKNCQYNGQVMQFLACVAYFICVWHGCKNTPIIRHILQSLPENDRYQMLWTMVGISLTASLFVEKMEIHGCGNMLHLLCNNSTLFEHCLNLWLNKNGDNANANNNDNNNDNKSNGNIDISN